MVPISKGLMYRYAATHGSDSSYPTPRPCSKSGVWLEIPEWVMVSALCVLLNFSFYSGVCSTCNEFYQILYDRDGAQYDVVSIAGRLPSRASHSSPSH